MYRVKEIFYTLQGEGMHSGTPAVFVRFSRCNLWSGKETDRGYAVCKFCDTEFLGTTGVNGGEYTKEGLLHKVQEVGGECKFIVCTGGEPMLQVDLALVSCLRNSGYYVCLETNGTLDTSRIPFDWVCVSPKVGSQWVVHKGNELKLVFPQSGGEPGRYLSTEFQHYFLQPMDGPNQSENTQLALQYCLDNPRWKLSLQTHKMIGIP